jgi:uncharacterized membrane protein YkoI
MGTVSKFFVMLAMALLMGATVPHVQAGPCGDMPCEKAEPPDWAGQGSREKRERDDFPPGLNDRDSYETQGHVFQTRKERRRAERQRKRQRRQIEILSQPGDDDDDDGRYVQFNEQEQGLIGPTEALTQALAAVPGGKALGVQLLKGQTPMYAVKLRVRGKVRRILVDARTAQILGE